jgi:hypothetical protein
MAMARSRGCPPPDDEIARLTDELRQAVQPDAPRESPFIIPGFTTTPMGTQYRWDLTGTVRKTNPRPISGPRRTRGTAITSSATTRTTSGARSRTDGIETDTSVEGSVGPVTAGPTWSASSEQTGSSSTELAETHGHELQTSRPVEETGMEYDVEVEWHVHVAIDTAGDASSMVVGAFGTEAGEHSETTQIGTLRQIDQDETPPRRPRHHTPPSPAMPQRVPPSSERS